MKLHIVRPGDTLRKIARRFDIPVQRLVEANPSLDPERPKPGAKVKIPGGKVPVTRQRKEKVEIRSHKSKSRHPESGKEESPESPEEKPLPKGPSYGWGSGQDPSQMIPPMPKAPEYPSRPPEGPPVPPGFIRRKESPYMQPIPYPLPPMGMPYPPQQPLQPMHYSAIPAPGYDPLGKGRNAQPKPWWPEPGYSQLSRQGLQPQQGSWWPGFPVPSPWQKHHQALWQEPSRLQGGGNGNVAGDEDSPGDREPDQTPDSKKREWDFTSLLSEEELSWEESSREK